MRRCGSLQRFDTHVIAILLWGASAFFELSVSLASDVLGRTTVLALVVSGKSDESFRGKFETFCAEQSTFPFQCAEVRTRREDVQYHLLLALDGRQSFPLGHPNSDAAMRPASNRNNLCEFASPPA